MVCPFHALGFDSEGCTILPGAKKKTLPQLEPLELIIQGDFIWSCRGQEPKVPIPTILNEIAAKYDFIGHTSDRSIETDLLPMLLNMHDYNHQNGTHRPLFRIEEVQFKKFIDNGHQSHIFYTMPTSPTTLIEKISNLDLLLLPKVLKAHWENHFPSLVIFHGETGLGKVAQCHLFVPESEMHRQSPPQASRTYVLMFGQAKNPVFKPLGSKFFNFAKVVVEQDPDILRKIYSNTPQKIKLNNEVGMDWVRRNFKSFPNIVEPNLSK